MGAFPRALSVGSLATGLIVCLTVKDGATAGYNLDFSKQKYTERSPEINDRSVKFRAYEGIIYARGPVGTKYEVINIYVPEAYYSGGSVGGFTTETAPIFFPNQIGGYMPVEPGKPGFGRGDEASQTPNAVLTALSKGYVVTSPGARGRTATNGKTPVAIVDLKTTVHYLKFNDRVMLEDADKAISNGTSAGGALSALLSTTSSSRDYEAYLKALGMTEGGDGIFAVSAYCPITDLDRTNMAHKRQFNGINDYQKMNISMLDYNVRCGLIPGILTKKEISLSNQLKPLYPACINSLKLKNVGGRALTLDKNGNGSFEDYVVGYLAESAQSQLNTGKKLSNRNWLTIKNGKVAAVDFNRYAKAVGRQKIPLAFGDVDLSTGGNQLFGDAQTDKRYLTRFPMRYSTAENAAIANTETIKIMNPLNYIGTSGVKVPQNWHIHIGTANHDTSLAMSAVLAAKLQNNGYVVDYFLPWDVPHNGDYDLEELFVRMK